MSFRSDVLVNKTSKIHQCEWCRTKIEAASQMVRISGFSEDFYTGKFHPECWRAEHAWFEQAREERVWEATWPGSTMKRGTITDYYEDEVRQTFSAGPLTKEEVANPPRYLISENQSKKEKAE